jgi:cell division protein YceG involved in septum cleavage
VAQPAQTDYLFFVVDCTAEQAGQHVFSRTFEEHLANVEACR